MEILILVLFLNFPLINTTGSKAFRLSRHWAFRPKIQDHLSRPEGRQQESLKALLPIKSLNLQIKILKYNTQFRFQPIVSTQFKIV